MIEPIEEKLFVQENTVAQFIFTVRNTITGQTLPLTSGDEWEFFIKPSRQSGDTDTSVVKLTRSGGDVTFQDSSIMIGELTIPANAIPLAALKWYRLDVITSVGRQTAKFGNLVIQDV